MSESPPSELDIRDLQLDRVPCPCSAGVARRMSIVDMGVLRSVERSDDGSLRIGLELTDPSCMFAMTIAEDIHHRLSQRGDGGGGVTVDFEYSDELWSENRMTPEARQKLKVVRDHHRGDRHE